MCGIAGVVDLSADRPVDPAMLARMGRAVLHRGPDEDGQLLRPGLGLASQRLSIIGLANGRQPLFNEDGSVVAVCNGEFFDYPEVRARLESRGHRFSSDSDCEILVHLWEEHGPGLFEHLRGQFAFALADLKNRRVVLGRDRLGICPLYYSIQNGFLYFGSEIKSLLASGQVPAAVDRLGLDHNFSFFAMGMRRTMFAGVQALLPGHYLDIAESQVQERQYWDLDFPDQGQERRGPGLLEEFDSLLRRAVDLRLRADVPVVSYLSGGVDSTTIASLASQSLGRPIPTFTIQIRDPKLDELPRALLAARAIGTEPQVLECGNRDIAAGYADLVTASECPVIDTSSAAIYQLAALVRRAGYKVALTGEGADEALAGYPWFKVYRLTGIFDRLGWGTALRRRLLSWTHLRHPWEALAQRYELMGGYHATADLYAACSLGGTFFYSSGQREAMGDHTACHDLVLNRQRMRAWHPLNRSLYLGYKVMLAGLLMTHKGDRPAMANSVETRFPFLDEEVVHFCAQIAPELKLRGWRRDKHLLRCLASRFLPAAIADRPKHIFRARYTQSFFDPTPPWVQQLLSPESLRQTGYFDPERVAMARSGKLRRRLEMGLVAVISSQLWHHLFLGGGLCDLPPWAIPSGE